MKFTVYKKIMLGFGAIITIVIISSSYILFELNTVSNGAKNILNSNVQAQELARQLQTIIQDENEYAEKYFVSNDETYLSLCIETSKQVDLNLKILLDKQSSKKDQSLIHRMQKAHDSFVAGVQEKVNKESNPNTVQSQIRHENMSILLNSLDVLITKNQSFIGKEMGRIESITTRAVEVALVLIAGTLIIAIAAALIITRTITKPIGDLIKGTEQIAKGKFDKILVSSHDEIGLLADAVNDMSSKINDINELRSQMMQQISHELKTPLQAIQSAHDILKISEPVKHHQIQLFDIINRSVDKIANFSQQYLDLTKIESGAMQYNMELTDIYTLIEPVVDDAKIVAGSKHINLELNGVEVPKVMADAEKVSIIISNLIGNAIKYTPKDGKVVVSISPGGLGVQVMVEDSGIGISQDEISKVFTRFYQVNDTKKKVSNGSGVGLAIVKAYTEGHGGKIHVDSSLDQGSSFIVEFPIGTDPVSIIPDNSKI